MWAEQTSNMHVEQKLIFLLPPSKRCLIVVFVSSCKQNRKTRGEGTLPNCEYFARTHIAMRQKCRTGIFQGAKLFQLGKITRSTDWKKWNPLSLKLFPIKTFSELPVFYLFKLIKINFHLFSRFLFLRIFQDHYQCLLTKNGHQLY